MYKRQGKYSADQIVAKYGTHVVPNITVGGSYIDYYKSAIIEENTGTEKMCIRDRS